MTRPAIIAGFAVGILAAGAVARADKGSSDRVDASRFDTLEVYWNVGITKEDDGQAPILQSPKAQKERKQVIAGLCALAREDFVVGKGENGRGLFSKKCGASIPWTAAAERLVPRGAVASGRRGKRRPSTWLRLDFAPDGEHRHHDDGGRHTRGAGAPPAASSTTNLIGSVLGRVLTGRLCPRGGSGAAKGRARSSRAFYLAVRSSTPRVAAFGQRRRRRCQSGRRRRGIGV